jgi:thioredoxin reductase (NADPH)
MAGLTAGLVCARLGLKTLVLAGDVLGGHLLSIERVDGIPGFPEGIPGYDLCPMTQEQAAAAGAIIKSGKLDGFVREDGHWRLRTEEGDVRTRALILATGASLKELGTPAAARLRGKGVSHCATCDGPLLRNRPVAVVGGGDSALQEALTLAEFASRVIVLHRGNALAAQAAYRERAEAHPRIELRLETAVEDVLGEDKVSGVRMRCNRTAADLEVAGVFVYIGLAPNTAFLRDWAFLDPTGRIVTDARMRTGQPGVLAAGVVRAGSPGRAVGSAGEGAIAAVAAGRYLSDGEWR